MIHFLKIKDEKLLTTHYYDLNTRQWIDNDWGTPSLYESLGNVKNIIYSDDPEEVFNFVKGQISFSNKSIQSNDKIRIINSEFPALLLGRINVDIKRTTKLTNTTKIITSETKFKCANKRNFVFTYDVENKIIYARPGNAHWNTFCDFQGLDSEIKEVYDKYNSTVYYGYQLTEASFELSKIYYSYPNNFINTRKLIEYTDKFTTIPTESEMRGYIQSLTSSDIETAKLAVSTLQYFNLSDYTPELVKALMSIKHNYGGYRLRALQSSAFNYIVYRLGINIGEIDNGYMTERRHAMIQRHVWENSITSPIGMNKLKEDIKKRLIETIMSSASIAADLEMINCEIVINDKVGETELSN